MEEDRRITDMPQLREDLLQNYEDASSLQRADALEDLLERLEVGLEGKPDQAGSA